jgi:hypothetical protein
VQSFEKDLSRMISSKEIEPAQPGGITKKRKCWNSSPNQAAIPAKPYSIGICSIARNPQAYSGGRVWAEPTELAGIQTPFYGAKKIKNRCIKSVYS